MATSPPRAALVARPSGRAPRSRTWSKLAGQAGRGGGPAPRRRAWSKPLLCLACAVAVLPHEARGQAAAGRQIGTPGADAEENGRQTGWLGIRVDIRMAFPGPLRDSIAVVVADVYPGGPADMGGVARGDRLLAVDGVAFDGWEAWGRFTAGLAPGRALRLALLRDGTPHEATVVAGEPPSAGGRVAPRLAADPLAWRDLAGTQARMMRTMDSLLRVAASRMGEVERSWTRTRSFDLLIGRVGPVGRRDSLAPNALRRVHGPIQASSADALPVEGGGGPSLRSFRNETAWPAPMMTPALLRNPFVFGGALARDLTEELGRYFGRPAGVLIIDVLPRTPAAMAGFQPGDVIVSVDGRATPALATLRAALADKGPPYEIDVVRQGSRTLVRYPRP